MRYSSKKQTPAEAWMRLATAYSQMTMAAGQVIFHRTMQMAQGTMTGPEATGMVLEKVTAFAASAERATVAAARGGDPVAIATAALKPYGVKTRSNARKFRQR